MSTKTMLTIAAWNLTLIAGYLLFSEGASTDSCVACAIAAGLHLAAGLVGEANS